MYNSRAANHLARRTLTPQWRDFKKSLRRHLQLPSHSGNFSAFRERQGPLIPTYRKADTTAGLNLISMVYANIKTEVHMPLFLNQWPRAICKVCRLASTITVVCWLLILIVKLFNSLTSYNSISCIYVFSGQILVVFILRPRKLGWSVTLWLYHIRKRIYDLLPYMV